jgi:hypothetical protein
LQRARHPTQLTVERVEHLAVDLAEQKAAEDRAHVSIEVADVRASRRVIEVDNLEIAVKQMVDGGLRAGVAALVDLTQ